MKAKLKCVVGPGLSGGGSIVNRGIGGHAVQSHIIAVEIEGVVVDLVCCVVCCAVSALVEVPTQLGVGVDIDITVATLIWRKDVRQTHSRISVT